MIWCLVQLPNNTTLAIECANKPDGPSIGQQCLEKVCKDLDIKCETEYFGLVLRKPSDKPKTATNHEWINLRNPLPQMNGQQILLELRVKFWVPAHLILQDSVRNIFYMQARNDLLEGRLKAISWENAAKLGALLAQADEMKYDDTYVPAECLFTEPKKNCDTSFNGKGKKRKLSKQRSVEDGVGDDEVSIPQQKPKSVYEKYIIRPDIEEEDAAIPCDFIQGIAKEHSKLINLKMTSKSAKYWLLESISKLPRFGEEMFTGTTVNDTACCDISVGPHGIVVYKPMEQIRIPFSAASSATPMKNLFRLTYLTEENSTEVLEIKMSRSKTATCLYRAITEKHAFYSCETVCSDVTTQFIRDLKGTIASMFNVDTKSGRLYVFDIERTCREVHDHARRVLHLRGIEIFSQSTDMPELGTDFDDLVQSQIDSKAKMDAKISERIAEALTCLICVDHSMNSIFVPCGHVLCCESCALRCETCPLCRSPVSAVNKIFLPTFQSEQKRTIKI
ncbi:E3 ubiquitin-protein ligase MYLIP [Bradysia coprophila]|uniref:E3 ubiquitin-protein ligase MYLIP n=1 Tax=Bradysia coprophila TaxID=38358 RepID=UPI00187DA29E|nr:E3 ubiquitin-protein ligase MYLIP [Bradysia coprophila]